MTNLAIVIHSLRGGGAERVLTNLLKGLEGSAFSIRLILYESIFDYPLPQNIIIESLDIAPSTKILRVTKRFVEKIIRLALLFRKNKPDVIFSLLCSTNVAVVLAKILSGVDCRLVISEHTFPSINLFHEPYGRITRLLVQYCYPMADKIIAVSEQIKDDLITGFRLPEHKIEVIHNPIDIEEIERLSKEKVDHPWLQSATPVIVSVGRLTRQKGYPFLLKAFSLARRELPCYLIILGEGEDRPLLMTLSRELGIEEAVQFLGFQSNPFKFMAKSSLFVLSSLYEGFPNVLLEAMALGLPIISTDCPSGPSEIIQDRKNGVLVPARDERSLAAAIVSVLKDEQIRRMLSSEARRRARDFALGTIVRKYERVFNENSSSPL